MSIALRYGPGFAATRSRFAGPNSSRVFSVVPLPLRCRAKREASRTFINCSGKKSGSCGIASFELFDDGALLRNGSRAAEQEAHQQDASHEAAKLRCRWLFTQVSITVILLLYGGSRQKTDRQRRQFRRNRKEMSEIALELMS
jgi:hypothetical protein